MKRSTLALVVILAAGAPIAFNAFASPGGGDGLHAHLFQLLHKKTDGGGFAAHLDQVSEHLGLTVEQRAAVANAIGQRIDPVADAARALITSHRAHFEAIHRSPLDEAGIREASHAVSTAQEELAVKIGALHASVISVLDDEQRTRLGSLHQNGGLASSIGDHLEQALRTVREWVDANRD